MLEFRISLPEAVADIEAELIDSPVDGDEARLVALVRAGLANVAGGGGPIAAGIWNQAGDLVSLGVNVVVAQHCSIAHAEMVAIGLAQARLSTFDLRSHNDGPFTLYTTAQMCAMCAGAVPWSGVTRVVASATTDDVESIAGFDEGPQHPDLAGEYAARGIALELGVRRDLGQQVLSAYRDAGGQVYNP